MKHTRHALAVLLFVVSALFLATTGRIEAQSREPLPGFSGWDDVLSKARGTTVRWYMWGGSTAINEFVDSFYGDLLKKELGITLERVPVADTRDAVNIVLSETEAGKKTNGSVDLIWINGLNFATLRQADLLYGPWAEAIPNAALVDWEDPTVAYDFGVPVDGYESPWSGSQFQFIYDPARMSENELPRSFDELTAWIKAHPGRFTYVAPGPGAFQGTRFVKQVLYAVSGGYQQFLGSWKKAVYEAKAPALWKVLNEWKPYLWRKGATYPATVNELHQLFANGEVDFSITLASGGAGPAIASGQLPPTARAFAFRQYMIGDYNYVAIPANASNKAAALVVANLLLRPDRQAGQILPETGFGLGYAIRLDRVQAADRALLGRSLTRLGPGAANIHDLQASFAPDLAPESQAAIEKDWAANVLRK